MDNTYKLKISFISQVSGERVFRTYSADNHKEVIDWFNKYGIGTEDLKVEEMEPRGFMVVRKRRVRV